MNYYGVKSEIWSEIIFACMHIVQYIWKYFCDQFITARWELTLSVISSFICFIFYVIIIAGIGIVFNVAGCLIRGRRRWSVTYTSPRGPRISEFLEFGIEGHFRRENLTSFLVG